MTNKIVLIDSFGDPGIVAAELNGLPVEVTTADSIPEGSGIVALLLGPGTELKVDHLAKLPDLRIVATTSAGHDHVPVEAVAAAGCWVTTAAGYATDEVAEHTIAMIIDLLRGVTVLDRSVRTGRWNALDHPPRRIAGAVLGLIGFGRIARAVATRATALGMRVEAYAPTTSDSDLTEYGITRHHTLTALLSNADVASLHLPLTAATELILDADAIAAMKPGSVLINTSRGGLVDHAALAAALESGRLSGAGLDVLPTEPPPADEPMLGMPGVIINPHAAWYSPQAAVRPFQLAAQSVADVLHGQSPRRAIAGPLPASGKPSAKGTFMIETTVATPSTDSGPSTGSGSEREVREELAAVYRLVAHYGMTDLIFTHISSRLPGPDHHFLINPYGLLFEEITASSLVKINLDGEPVEETPYRVNPAGFVIHSAIHRARPDANSVLHTHTKAGCAVAAQKQGLLPVNQMSMEFYNRVAYHDYEGVALNLDEQERLVTDLGTDPVMILRNHGLLTVGGTAPQAFFRMFYLQRACEIQLAAQTNGAELVLPPEDVRILAGRQLNGEDTESDLADTGGYDLAWQAMLRLADRIAPDYRD